MSRNTKFLYTRLAKVKHLCHSLAENSIFPRKCPFFKRDFDQLGSGILDLSLALIDFLIGHSIVALLKITMNLSGLSQIIIQKLPKIHTCKPIICYDDGR